MCIVGLGGYPYEFVGPFEDRNQAQAFADKEKANHSSAVVVSLTKPEEYYEKRHEKGDCDPSKSGR